MAGLRSLPFALALATLGAPAVAQEVMSATCVGAAPATQILSFENGEHRRWHRRFWTGSCADLGFFCSSGSPYWSEEAARLIARAAAGDRPAIKVRVCRLGQRIGHEWARNNADRRIDNDDLRAYYALLNAGSDLDQALGAVERRVDQALAAD